MTSSKPFSNTNPRWQSPLCQRSERIRRTVESNGVSETRAYETDNTLASINFAGASIGNLTYGWDASKDKTSEAHIASSLPPPRTQQASCSDSKSRLPRPVLSKRVAAIPSPVSPRPVLGERGWG